MIRMPQGMMSLLVLAAAWVTAVRAECPKEVPIQVSLSAEEFALPGYDAAKGILAIRPLVDLPQTPHRPTPIRLMMAKREIHMRVPAAALKLVLDPGPDALELIIEGHPSARVTGKRSKECDEVVPQRAILKRDGLPIAEVDMPRIPVGRPSLGARVKITVDEGAVRADILQHSAIRLARQCGAKIGDQASTLRGALSLELKKSLLDEVQPVKVVVDGLVNQRFTYCLVASVQDTNSLWKGVEPGSRVYVNLYLTGYHRPGSAQD